MTKDKAGAWINGHQKALATLTAALGEGVLIANGGRNKFASGFMLETFTTGQISIVQGISIRNFDGKFGKFDGCFAILWHI